MSAVPRSTGLGKALAPLDLAFDGFADELGAAVGAGDLVNALRHPLGEANKHRLYVHRRATHAGPYARLKNNRQFVLQKRYRLLTVSDIAYRVKSSKQGDDKW